jgi:hypothetical protein
MLRAAAASGGKKFAYHIAVAYCAPLSKEKEF